MEIKVEYDFGNAMAYLSQSWNWLENGWSKDDKIFREVWKVGEVRIAEAKERREKRREELRRKGAEEGGRKKEKEE